MIKIIYGKNYRWFIQESIGKGDAGEVLQVVSEDQQVVAVMKRPVQNSTGGTIMRQATQIENESRILDYLDGLKIKQAGMTMLTPKLLDVSMLGTSNTAAFFMVSQQVRGMSLTEIIQKSSKIGAPVSHLLFLKIFLAVFVMLREIHKRRVIWNDVKTDHIYWDEVNHSVSFIDWGNGRIIESESNNYIENHNLFYNDYEQLTNELNKVLATYSPMLLTELDLLDDNGMYTDEFRIDLLEKRIKYLMEYFQSQAIEKKGQVRHYLKHIRNIEGLDELFMLIKELERIGEFVDKNEVNNCVFTLFIETANSFNYSECIKICEKMILYMGEEVNFPWVLLNELLVNENVTDFPLAQFAKMLFDEEWEDTAWTIKNSTFEKDIKERLIHKIRLKALPAQIEGKTPLLLLKSIADNLHIWNLKLRVKNETDTKLAPLKEISSKIDTLINSWSSAAQEKRLGGELLALCELIPQLQDHGIDVPKPLSALLSGLLMVTRSIYQKWNEGEIEECRKLIRKFHLWDPDYEDLQVLDRELEVQSIWLNNFISGPSEGQSLKQFLIYMIDSQPIIKNILGEPIWLKEISENLSNSYDSGNIAPLSTLSKMQNLPMSWLTSLENNSFVLSNVIKTKLSTEHLNLLNEFHQVIKNGKDTKPLLDRIKLSLPSFYSYYQSIVESFKNLLMPLNPTTELPLLENAPDEDREPINKILEVLHAVTIWRRNVESRNWILAETSLLEWQDWYLPSECNRSLWVWRKTILPVIADLRQKNRKSSQIKSSKDIAEDATLQKISQNITEGILIWEKIEKYGVDYSNAEMLKSYYSLSEQAFLEYWSNLMHSTSQSMQFIAHVNQMELSTTYHHLLQLGKLSRKLSQAMEIISRSELTFTQKAYNSAGDLMNSLISIENILKTFDPNSQIRLWHQQYLQFMKLNTKVSMNDFLSTIDSNHPLFSWFKILASHDFLSSF